MKQIHPLCIFIMACLLFPSQAESQRIGIVNPDTMRVIPFGHGLTDTTYSSLADGIINNCHDDSTCEGWQDPNAWSEVGTRSDFIGQVLSDSGYTVDYFSARNFPEVSSSPYDLVIVQDPMTQNLRSFNKDSVDATLPDLLDHVTDTEFLDSLKAYFNNGGNLLLVGDAVELLEDGTNRLNFGKQVQHSLPNHSLDTAHSLLPENWLFTRGQPFCCNNRTASGQYVAMNSPLTPEDSVLSSIGLYDRYDLGPAFIWPEVVYHPVNSTSLLDIRMSGSGEYVLEGGTCQPPEYQVSMDDTLSHYMGYTTYQSRRIYYIGSHSFFNFHLENYQGNQHCTGVKEISHTLSTFGRQAIVNLVEQAAQTNVQDSTVNVTFNVDVGGYADTSSTYDPATDSLYITGNLIEPIWAEPGTVDSALMRDPDNDSIFTWSAPLPANDSFSYKYSFVPAEMDSSWKYTEWAGFENRTLHTGSNDTSFTHILGHFRLKFQVGNRVRPLESARVEIHNTTLTTQTDGEATFIGLPGTTYGFSISKPGYKTLSDSATIGYSDDTLAITLRPYPSDTIKHEIYNGSRWFGGDPRADFGPRNVGTGQSIIPANYFQADSFAVRLTGAFGEQARLKLSIRDSAGSLIDTAKTTVDSTFMGGWVTFNLDALNLQLEPSKKYIFAWHLINGLTNDLRNGSAGDTKEKFFHGSGYSSTVYEGEDINNWTHWSSAGWDFCFKLYGDISHLDISFSQMDWGTRLQGYGPVDSSMTLFNTGPDSMAIDSITGVQPPFIVDLSGSQSLSDTLAPRDSIPLNLTLSTDTSPGSYYDTLNIYSDERDTSIFLQGQIRKGPVLSLSTASGEPADTLDFGDHYASTDPVYQTVYLTNQGDMDLTIDSLTAPGAPFLMDPFPCEPGEDTLVPGDTTNMGITLTTDTTAGVYADTCKIFTNGRDTSMLLRAELSVGPRLEVSPANLLYGKKIIHTGDSTQNLNLYNTGDETLVVDSLIGPEYPFTLKNDFGQELPDTIFTEDSVSLSLTFHSDTLTGVYNDSLLIGTNDRDTTIALNGELVKAPEMNLSTDTVDFGPSAINSGTISRDVWLINAGGLRLGIDSIGQAGAPFEVYPVNLEPGRDSIAPADSARLSISLSTDTALGNYHDTVKIYSSRNDTSLIMQAEVALGPQMDISADTLNFGRVAPQTGLTTLACFIKNTGDAPLRVDPFNTHQPPFLIQAEGWNPSSDAIPPSDSARIEVTLSSDTLTGYYHHNLQIHTNNRDTTLLVQAKLMTHLRITVNESSDPITGAHIQINDKQWRTDSSGQITLPLNRGDYTISASAPGYFALVKNISVSSVNMKEINLELGVIGDYNVDGTINYQDLDALFKAWNQQVTTIEFGPFSGDPPEMEVHADGKIDFEDLLGLTFMYNYRDAQTKNAIAWNEKQTRQGPAHITMTRAANSLKPVYNIWLKGSQNYRSSKVLIRYPNQTLHLKNIEQGRYFSQLEGHSAFLKRKAPNKGLIELDMAKTGSSLSLDEKEPLARLTFTRKAASSEREIPSLSYQYQIHENNGPQSKGQDKAQTSTGDSPQMEIKIYPNPAGKYTRLSLLLPEKAHVKASIYSTKGHKVATLLNRKMSAGSHTRTWQCQKVPSGIYYLRLQYHNKHYRKKFMVR